MQCNTTKEERSSHSIYTDVIKESYTNSSLKGPGGERNLPYWWNQEISEKRKQCVITRRRYTKLRRRGDGEAESLRTYEEYKWCKKELRKLIGLSKKEHWNRLWEELNNNIGGDGYKIAVKGIKQLVPHKLSDRERKEIVRNFSCVRKGKRIIAEREWTLYRLSRQSN
ncbi:hypothetical protein QE152_g27070 [Popillia japonica]|uniref:Uncharacterized protein n=1 Tax=Popillia japonica TaxID=7064 RepID=A0AAW1JWI4_POPJA